MALIRYYRMRTYQSSEQKKPQNNWFANFIPVNKREHNKPIYTIVVPVSTGKNTPDRQLTD